MFYRAEVPWDQQLADFDAVVFANGFGKYSAPKLLHLATSTPRQDPPSPPTPLSLTLSLLPPAHEDHGPLPLPSVEMLDGSSVDPKDYNGYTASIAEPGVLGLGFGFPEQWTDPDGFEEHRVGGPSFMFVSCTRPPNHASTKLTMLVPS